MLIRPFIPSILLSIDKNQIVILKSGVGTGKSTILPVAIALTGAHIYVSCPTIDAARNLQTTVSDNFGIKYDPKIHRGQKRDNSDEKLVIGLSAEGEIKYDYHATDITFMTAGHLKNRLLGSIRDGKPQNFNMVDVIIIDEAHSGTIENTMIAAIWYFLAKAGKSVPRLILMSGTLNNKWKLFLTEATTYVVDIKSLPVETRYIDESFQERDIRNPRGRLYDRIIEKIFELLSDKVLISKYPGDILVFLPGQGEINQMRQRLIEILFKSKSDIDVLRVYGNLDQSERDMIYGKTSKKKIILGTNIVETSVTIESIDIVIDSMVEKRLEENYNGGTKLSTHFISKDSANQRRGRIGRVRPGFCLRMTTEEDFNKLEESRPDEIIRLPIHTDILKLVNRGIDSTRKLESFLPMIPLKKITKPLRRLILIGAVDLVNQERQEFKISDMGRFVSALDIEIRLCAVLFRAIQAKVPPFVAIVCVCIVDNYGPASYAYIPKETLDPKKYIDDKFGKLLGSSDFETLINIWNDMYDTTGGTFPVPDIKIRDYTTPRSLNNKKWKELSKSIGKTIKILESNFQIDSKPGLIKPVERVLEKMIPFFMEIFPEDILINDGPLYRRLSDGAIFIPDEDLIYNRERIPEKVQALSFREISKKIDSNRYLKMFVEIKDSWVANDPLKGKEKDILPIMEPRSLCDNLSELSEEMSKEISDLSDIDKEMYRLKNLPDLSEEEFEREFQKCLQRKAARHMPPQGMRSPPRSRPVDRMSSPPRGRLPERRPSGKDEIDQIVNQMSIRSISPSRISMRQPSPPPVSLASVRSTSPSRMSVRAPSPVSVRPISPSRMSVRDPSPPPVSVRPISPSRMSVRAPSPVSVRPISPSRMSVRAPSPDRSLTTSRSGLGSLPAVPSTRSQMPMANTTSRVLAPLPQSIQPTPSRLLPLVSPTPSRLAPLPIRPIVPPSIRGSMLSPRPVAPQPIPLPLRSTETLSMPPLSSSMLPPRPLSPTRSQMLARPASPPKSQMSLPTVRPLSPTKSQMSLPPVRPLSPSKSQESRAILPARPASPTRSTLEPLSRPVPTLQPLPLSRPTLQPLSRPTLQPLSRPTLQPLSRPTLEPLSRPVPMIQPLPLSRAMPTPLSSQRGLPPLTLSRPPSSLPVPQPIPIPQRTSTSSISALPPLPGVPQRMSPRSSFPPARLDESQ